MLTPSANDSNRKSEVKRKQSSPQDWGPTNQFTGNRGNYKPNTK